MWELLSPKEKIVLLRKDDDGEFWYLTQRLGARALAYIRTSIQQTFTGCLMYARHLLYRDQEDPLGAHGLAGQSNSHSLCDKSRDPWHGTQRVLKAEGGCGHCLVSDFCFLPTISHRTCALQSKAVLLPPTPKPLTPFYERSPDTLS